jgi:hypothetical protein
LIFTGSAQQCEAQVVTSLCCSEDISVPRLVLKLLGV